MAKTDAVWGIDIGQCALKALRCRPHEDEKLIIADAFDFIEYPKILTQPDAEPEAMVAEALQQFLSRNNIHGDRVAVSVSGQSGLARFIKLPPVESKKIPDIVRFEARQQIPFDLNDVIWDYQRMGGGVEEEGFALETEIGLFAMKREAVFRALEPYQRAGIEVDFIQLTPLALYNWLLFDQMDDLPPPEEYDPEDPPESVVIFSLGTDATDLVVTNGYRVWQRSIPIGGNHFTKALTKELKLTFAKAEHLKRNATAAQDPKAIFQAMRPIFNDLLTELQRSIGYFTNIDRNAKIGRVVALGNAMKLSGLQTYLTKSLGHEVERIDEFKHLVGPQVLSAPAFQENSLAFSVCYGLALQGMGKPGLRTNLLPREIVKDRLIRQKKPWAVAAAAVLLMACTISFAASSLSLSTVREEDWTPAEGSAKGVKDEADRHVSGKDAAIKTFKEIDLVGSNLVKGVDNRVLWLELLYAINECLPRNQGPTPKDVAQGAAPKAAAPGAAPEDAAKQREALITQRREMHVTNLDCQYLSDVSVWYKGIEKWYLPPEGSEADPKKPKAAVAEKAAPKQAPAAGAKAEAGGDKKKEAAKAAVSGPGWIVRVSGYHYHNPKTPDPKDPGGTEFVRQTLIDNLHNKKITLPNADRTAKEEVSLAELGVSYPVLVAPENVIEEKVIDPNALPALQGGGPGGAGALAGRMPGAGLGPGVGSGGRPGGPDDPSATLRRLNFVVHFCWKPTPPTERRKAREEAEKLASKDSGEKPDSKQPGPKPESKPPGPKPESKPPGPKPGPTPSGPKKE